MTSLPDPALLATPAEELFAALLAVLAAKGMVSEAELQIL